jgi:hypothetical protein
MRRAAAALVLIAAPAAAEIPCDCDRACPDRAPVAAARYDADGGLHRAWYEDRFWRGVCSDALSGEGCLDPDSWLARLLGADLASWWALMAAGLERVPEPERPALCGRLRALGRDMGYEWARLNHVRRICTDDLAPLFEALRDAPDPRPVVAEMEALTAARLAGDAPCRPE